MQDQLKEVFGSVLQKIRNEKGMSQEKLANLANLDRSYISRLERGIQNPSLNNLFAISKALDISPHEFVRLVENELSR